MPSYQERSQIIKALAEQEYFDALQKEQNKSVQIGAKRGDTGRHQVIHSDGGVTSNGDKIFNAAAPADGFVRASINPAVNAIAVDHRNVKPQPRRLPQEEVKLYPVKVVYVVYPDNYDAPKATVDFYIGGDRPDPELILQLPTKKNGEYISFYLQDTKLTNTGNTTDDWILQLTYNYNELTSNNYTLVYCRTVSPQYGDIEYKIEENGFSSYMLCGGYGAFIDSLFSYSNSPYYDYPIPSGIIGSTNVNAYAIQQNVSFSEVYDTFFISRQSLTIDQNFISIPSTQNPIILGQYNLLDPKDQYNSNRFTLSRNPPQSGLFPSSISPSQGYKETEYLLFFINSLTANSQSSVNSFQYKQKQTWGGLTSYDPQTLIYNRTAVFEVVDGQNCLRVTESITNADSIRVQIFDSTDPRFQSVITNGDRSKSVTTLIRVPFSISEAEARTYADKVFNVTVGINLFYFTSKGYESTRDIPSLFNTNINFNQELSFFQSSPLNVYDRNINTFSQFYDGARFLNTQFSFDTSFSKKSTASEPEINIQVSQPDPEYNYLGTNGTDTTFWIKTIKTTKTNSEGKYYVEIKKKITAWITVNQKITEKDCPNTEIISYITVDNKGGNNFINYNRWIALFLDGKNVCINNQIQVVGKPLLIDIQNGKNPSDYITNIWKNAIDYSASIKIFKHEVVLGNSFNTNGYIYENDHNVTDYNDLTSNPDISSLGTVDYIKSLGVEGNYRDFPYKQGDKVFVSMYEWDKDFNLKRVDLPSDTVEYFSVDTGSIIFQKGYSYPTLWSAYLDN